MCWLVVSFSSRGRTALLFCRRLVWQGMAGPGRAGQAPAGMPPAWQSLQLLGQGRGEIQVGESRPRHGLDLIRFDTGITRNFHSLSVSLGLFLVENGTF